MFKPQFLVYLAGPITGLQYDDAIDWRRHVERLLHRNDIGVLSPLRNKQYLAVAGPLSAEGYPGYALSTKKGLTIRDRNDVRRCDLVFANLLGATRVSIGTMIELGWADAFQKPTIVVMDLSNIHKHAMVDTVAGWIVPTLEAGLGLIPQVLGNGCLGWEL